MKLDKTILLVEDELDDQGFFTECIEAINNATLFGIANNGIEALAKVENCVKLPDMIFMDINMPIMNGIECLKEIKKSSRLKNIPVVMLSTNTGQAALTRILGANGFIKKPPDCKTLQTKVEQMINLDFGADYNIANKTFQLFALA